VACNDRSLQDDPLQGGVGADILTTPSGTPCLPALGDYHAPGHRTHSKNKEEAHDQLPCIAYSIAPPSVIEPDGNKGRIVSSTDTPAMWANNTSAQSS
jgi:hypothetical protein